MSHLFFELLYKAPHWEYRKAGMLRCAISPGSVAATTLELGDALCSLSPSLFARNVFGEEALHRPEDPPLFYSSLRTEELTGAVSSSKTPFRGKQKKEGKAGANR